MISIRKRILLLTISIVLYTASIVSAPLPVIRISVENTKDHVQTKSVERFANIISKKLEGLYDVTFYSSAALYKDADIFRALAQGKVEIAVPGTWHFDKAVPEVGIFLLPRFYGRPATFSYMLMVSDVGTHIIDSIESKLSVKVLGSFIDLGSTQIFLTDSPIYKGDDFKDKTIRVAGGLANSLRMSSLGAQSVTIPWPALSLALQKKTIDALLTSYETIVSAQLHEAGIKYVYEDNQYFAQYIPLASRIFWDKLPLHIQQIIVSSWEEIVDEARHDAIIAQQEAAQYLQGENVTIITPSEDEITHTRWLLIQDEKDIGEQIGIPPTIWDEYIAFFEHIECREDVFSK